MNPIPSNSIQAVPLPLRLGRDERARLGPRGPARRAARRLPPDRHRGGWVGGRTTVWPCAPVVERTSYTYITWNNKNLTRADDTITTQVEDEAFVYDWIQRFGPTVPPPRAGNTWVALATPSLITLTAVPRLASSSPAYQGKGLFDAFFPDAPWNKRCVSTCGWAPHHVCALLVDDTPPHTQSQMNATYPGWSTPRPWPAGRWTRCRCSTRRASCTDTSAPPRSSSPRRVGAGTPSAHPITTASGD